MNRVALMRVLALGALCLGILSCAGDVAPSSSASSNPRPSSSASVIDRSSAVLSTEPWSWTGVTGAVIRTEHYRIYTTETDRVLVERLPPFLEDAMSHYRSAICALPGPPQRLDTYLVDNRPQWVRLTKRLLGHDAEPFLRIQRGGYATRGIAVLYDIGLFDTLAIAAHEGWHQYTQRTFSDGLPVWLEEGVASFMEGHKWSREQPVFLPWSNVERFDQLRAAEAAGRLLSLRELLGETPRDSLNGPAGATLNFYAQAWALVHFLNEGAGGRYRSALRNVILDAAEGRLGETMADRIGPRRAALALRRRVGPEVFLTYFNDDLDEAEREYSTFLRAIVSAGARDRIVAGRSPIEGAAP